MAAPMDENESVDFGPSELGLKSFWDKFYQQELDNFADHGDPGEIWFGEHTLNRIVKWILNASFPKDIPILDLGCGNGLLLLKLWNCGFQKLFGADYSPFAIDLAKKVAVEEKADIAYEVFDITQANMPTPSVLNQSYHICHDKGTYDAISLSPDADTDKKTYIESVWHLLKPNGFLILTSCNWTKDELLSHFQNYFLLVDSIPMAQFQFGGQTGQTVTSLVLKRVDR